MSLLEVSHLRKTYGATVSVDDLSFRVEAGEIFGLLGPNGAGKSTTMMIAAGLRRADSGTVNIAGQGQDIAEFKYFKRWFDELSERPALQRGMAVTAGPPEDYAAMSQEERDRRTALLYNQRARPAPVS